MWERGVRAEQRKMDGILNKLAEGMAMLGLEAPPEVLARLEIHLRELERWNPTFGLVNAEGEDLVVRHFLDSLAGVKPIRGLRPSALADVGSGAGFPGLPLAVCLPETRVTLVEPSQKRCAFLRSSISLMGLRNVGVFEGELAVVKEKFDCVTFRAFRPLDRRIVRGLRSILADGGTIAAYKGKADRIREELEAAGIGEEDSRVVEMKVPFLGEPRHLVMISNGRPSGS